MKLELQYLLSQAGAWEPEETGNQLIRRIIATIGQKERTTQNRVVKLFKDHLGCRYLGDWRERENNSNIEKALLQNWLSKGGISETLINRTFHALEQASAL